MSPIAFLLAAMAPAMVGSPVEATQGPPATPAERGRAIAETRCAACHAVGEDLSSPRRGAPAFRDLKGRFVPLTLERRLTDINETGHYDMPPLVLHTDQIEDVAAYLETLDER